MVVAKVLDENICKQKKELVLREFNTMTKLHHPNIVQFLGYIDNPFIIVMEYIPKGDLLTNIPKLSKSQKRSEKTGKWNKNLFAEVKKPL